MNNPTFHEGVNEVKGLGIPEVEPLFLSQVQHLNPYTILALAYINVCMCGGK